jgi:hypothetical protein
LTAASLAERTLENAPKAARSLLCWPANHHQQHAKRYPPCRRRPRLQQLSPGNRPLDHGQIQRTEYLKETVRQGNGLDAERNLTPEAMQRGWDCLARFGERLAGFKRSQVRAVATQTLREARNRDEFLAQASSVLGFPIDVISGREEARLIYQGVAHLLPQRTNAAWWWTSAAAPPS